MYIPRRSRELENAERAAFRQIAYYYIATNLDEDTEVAQVGEGVAGVVVLRCVRSIQKAL